MAPVTDDARAGRDGTARAGTTPDAVLRRVLVDLDECRYRLEEARDEQDRRDRTHHNAGVDAAAARIHRVLELLAEAPTAEFVRIEIEDERWPDVDSGLDHLFGLGGEGG